MSASSVTIAGRAKAESIMGDTCQIHRETTTTDPDTGADIISSELIYSGSCRLRYPFVRPEDQNAGGQQLAAVRGVLSIPVSATGSSDVEGDDVATLTFSEMDPDTVGSRHRIESPSSQTFATARRFAVQTVSNA